MRRKGETLLQFCLRLQDQCLDVAERLTTNERKAVWEAAAIDLQPMIEAIQRDDVRNASKGRI